MTAQENKRLLKGIFAKMSEGDFDSFLGNMADDVRWTVIGNTLFSGTIIGREEAIENRMVPFGDAIDGLSFVTATNFIAEGDYVAVEASGKATTKLGKPYNNKYCAVFCLKDGRIQEITEYLDTEVVTAAFER